MTKLNKDLRQRELSGLINKNPFATDDELARLFAVSVQTIRLDRLELKIPELRERTKLVAEHAFRKVRSLTGGEFVGDLQQLELGKSAISIMEILPDMVAEKSRVCRGDHIYSQAATLAIALIDADIVLIGSARLRYKRPVYLHETILARAVFARKKYNKHLIKVVSKVDTEEVFVGKFILVAR